MGGKRKVEGGRGSGGSGRRGREGRRGCGKGLLELFYVNILVGNRLDERFLFFFVIFNLLVLGGELFLQEI